MIALDRVAGVLLCAGRSRRFGAGDKLLEEYAGTPLVAHIARGLAALPLLGNFAVVGPSGRDAPLALLLRNFGFALVENDAPDEGQDRSVRLGLAAALQTGCDAVLLCLGDMPHIVETHFQALAAAAYRDRAAVSWTGSWQSPPVVIPSRLAREILAHPGCTVRDALHPSVRVTAPAPMLADFDTPADFAAAGRST